MTNKNILITYEEFEKHINAICAEQELQLTLDNAFNKYCNESEHTASIWLPSLESNIVELLERVTDDKSKWISYWVCELCCGEKYYIGCVKINDKPVALKTVQDLWSLLNYNPHFETVN